MGLQAYRVLPWDQLGDFQCLLCLVEGILIVIDGALAGRGLASELHSHRTRDQSAIKVLLRLLWDGLGALHVGNHGCLWFT